MAKHPQIKKQTRQAVCLLQIDKDDENSICGETGPAPKIKLDADAEEGISEQA